MLSDTCHQSLASKSEEVRAKHGCHCSNKEDDHEDGNALVDTICKQNNTSVKEIRTPKLLPGHFYVHLTLVPKLCQSFKQNLSLTSWLRFANQPSLNIRLYLKISQLFWQPKFPQFCSIHFARFVPEWQRSLTLKNFFTGCRSSKFAWFVLKIRPSLTFK